MSSSRGPRRRATGSLLIAVAVLVAGWSAAEAGSISLRWDAISDADVAGYRLYHGSAPNELTEMIDVGNTTSATLSGLANCSWWYVSVRAYDQGGLESVDDSNLIHGLPRPIVQSVNRTQIRAGQTLTFTVEGANFDQGTDGDPNHPPARVELSHSALTVTQTSIESCNTLRVTIRAATDAEAGWSDLTVENADLSWDSPISNPWVFGTLIDAIEVLSDVDTTPPSVSGTEPPAGATEVPATVNPRVIFSEEIDPASINANNVRLLDAEGIAVSQEHGWPVLDVDTVTIRPEQPLEPGETYRIHVIGGPGGVRDVSGNPLPTNYTQDPGFTIMGDSRSDEDSGPSVLHSSPEPSQINVGHDLGEVRVTFDRDMRGLASILSQNELQQRFGVMSGETPLAQVANSPRFESSGHTICIVLAESLREDHAYATFAHLDGDDLRTRLAADDRLDLFMGRVWISRPGWRVEGAVESIQSEDPSSGTKRDLIPDSSDVPLDNTALPVGSRFHVTFTRPVVPSSARAGVFSLTIAAGRRHMPVELVEPLEIVDGGRTVVLESVETLPAGVWGAVRVMTGPAGVLLQGDGGSYSLPAGRPMTANFATEVLPENAGLGVAE